MKKLIVLALIIGALYHYQPDFSFLMKGKGAFDDQGNPLTLVFIHDQCGDPCKDAVKLLKKRRVDYSLFPLDNNEANQALWKEYGGVNSFPNIVIGHKRVYGSYKSPIVSALAMNYGSKVLTSTEKRFMKKHFNSDGSDRLVMYSASWCPYCKTMRKTLNDENIDFLEIDVEKSSMRRSMTTTMEITGYPLIYYGYNRMGAPSPRDVVKLF